MNLAIPMCFYSGVLIFFVLFFLFNCILNGLDEFHAFQTDTDSGMFSL